MREFVKTKSQQVREEKLCVRKKKTTLHHIADNLWTEITENMASVEFLSAFQFLYVAG